MPEPFEPIPGRMRRLRRGRQPWRTLGKNGWRGRCEDRGERVLSHLVAAGVYLVPAVDARNATEGINASQFHDGELTKLHAHVVGPEVPKHQSNVASIKTSALLPVQHCPPISPCHSTAGSKGGNKEVRVPGSVFSHHLVIFGLERQSGPPVALDITAGPQVVQRWREALLSCCEGAPERVHAIVSGHRPDGGPLEEPHLAFVPLACVGDSNADGRILGLAAAIPAGLDLEELHHVIGVLGKVREIRMGALGVWKLVRELGGQPDRNLDPGAWTAHPAGAMHWSTVTPAVFDRHPKGKDPGAYQRAAAEMVADACVAIGLPRPREVVVTPASAHLGAPPAHAFPRLSRKDGTKRRHAHAIIVFGQPVRGPVLIGAGRYRGYGVCRPIDVGPQ